LSERFNRRNFTTMLSKLKFYKQKPNKHVVKNHHGEDMILEEVGANPKRTEQSSGVVITLSTPRFSKSLSLGRVAKKAYLGLAIFLALFFFVGSGVIIYSASSIWELSAFLGDMKNAYERVQNENDGLKNLLSGSIEEKQKIKEFEKFVNDKNEAAGEMSKIDIASIVTEQKLMTLMILPSGYPCVNIGITSEFGSRNHPLLDRVIFHEGIDLKADYGTRVNASADGIVEYTKFYSGYGNMVVIDHSFGFKSIYGHLSAFTVKPGDFVRKGQMIAKSGASGLAAGPHLHYEVRFLNRALNPRPFLDWNADHYHQIFDKEKSIKWASLLEATKWQTSNH
jgi:murein DD-endopeptidase MepM/ murein hydrolase activator NlpD